MTSFRFNWLLSNYRESPKAVKELYEEFYPLIVRYINVRFHGQLDGRDIAHIFFVRLFEIKAYNIRSPNAWVYTVTKNIALEILSKSGKRFEAEEKVTIINEIELPNEIVDYLKVLTPIEQKIIYLHYWEKYKFKEIAGMFNIKYGSVKYYHRTAKKKLREEFKNEQI